jgi:hypothetical protein
VAEALDAYINEHRPVGGFLKAVISNDLFSAVALADSENMNLIGFYCRFLYNHAPSPCWGSRERYEAWISQAA